eukprot:GHRR01028865.1.p1 GENE.GHRR01028865.1~~GHRR01028865.1.p1  ORF type:complete len:185 (+),score=46.07 GHRR01028865.1:185-739(+)
MILKHAALSSVWLDFACDSLCRCNPRAHAAVWLLPLQETAWRQFGDITKINLYYNPVEQCLKGIKPTYGSNAANAQILGTETEGTTIYTTADLTLQAGEVFIKAEYKYGTRCFEYLKLTTNNDRTLTLGNSESTNPLQTSKPAASAGYLGFVKGYTDVPNTGASTCKLQQLQLYWVTSSCSGNP